MRELSPDSLFQTYTASSLFQLDELLGLCVLPFLHHNYESGFESIRSCSQVRQQARVALVNYWLPDFIQFVLATTVPCLILFRAGASPESGSSFIWLQGSHISLKLRQLLGRGDFCTYSDEMTHPTMAVVKAVQVIPTAEQHDVFSFSRAWLQTWPSVTRTSRS